MKSFSRVHLCSSRAEATCKCINFLNLCSINSYTMSSFLAGPEKLEGEKNIQAAVTSKEALYCVCRGLTLI
ncbi:hypothetical protein FKM82_021048 [Ascaphus truei]